jgi:hypothetical protein
MKRRGFLAALVGLAFAPKVAAAKPGIGPVPLIYGVHPRPINIAPGHLSATDARRLASEIEKIVARCKELPR